MSADTEAVNDVTDVTDVLSEAAADPEAGVASEAAVASSSAVVPDARAEVARHPILGGVDILVGLLLLGAIWFALPTRWLPMDIGGSLLAVGFVVAGAALLARRSWAAIVARSLGVAVLVAGASLLTALALAAGDLFGRYGPVGMGGGLILIVVFLLLLPYLVILPAAQLWLLAPGRHADETSAPHV